MNINILRYIEANHIGAEVRWWFYNFFRYHAIRQNFSIVVDVIEKKIESKNSLTQPLFYLIPFCIWNDSRYQIKGENFFRPLLVSIDRKGNTMLKKGRICLSSFFFYLVVFQTINSFKNLLVMILGHMIFADPEHLVKKNISLVIIEWWLIHKGVKLKLVCASNMPPA